MPAKQEREAIQEVSGALRLGGFSWLLVLQSLKLLLLGDDLTPATPRMTAVHFNNTDQI